MKLILECVSLRRKTRANAASLLAALLLGSVIAPTAHAQTAADLASPVTINRQRAYELFKALTGIPVPIDDARIKQMEALVAAGDETGAAKIATADPFFIDIRVRDIARPMSTREETIAAPYSDFVATFAGVTRDDLDARQLLTGNFYYIADPVKAPDVRATPLADIVNSNNHYADIQSKGYSLNSVLIKKDGQLMNAAGAAAMIPDAAGLLTTRAFIGAHADAGTNRRLVEFTFREFMCQPMQGWMDASRPDNFVGRDVDRFPGGSNEKYQVTCKACHTQMDAFRGAFAFVDWDGANFIKFSATVQGKYARNNQVFPDGYVTNGNTWTNYVTSSKNVDQFGWRGGNTGTGINQFGSLIANSQGFSRCMTRRFFTAICKREPATNEESVIRNIASDFEKDYKLKRLAETVAVNPLCLPKN